MAELCSKIAVLGSEFKEPIKPYLLDLIDALVCCFKDGCWQVRDAACVAISYFYTTFNEELPNKDTLVDLWIAHLSDNINHVRQKSAQAIAHVLRESFAGKDDLLKKISNHLSNNLLRAKD